MIRPKRRQHRYYMVYLTETDSTCIIRDLSDAEELEGLHFRHGDEEPGTVPFMQNEVEDAAGPDTVNSNGWNVSGLLAIREAWSHDSAS